MILDISQYSRMNAKDGHHLYGTTIHYGYVSTNGLVEGCTLTYANADVFMLGQNTNKPPLQELPWPSELTPKDDLPEMDAFFSCHLVDHPNELVLYGRRYNSRFEEYSAMLENQRQLATDLVTCLGDLSPGQVQDIGGGAMPQCIEKELNESIRLGKYLSKAVCYIDSPWPGGDTSPQSLGEKKILREQASELAQQLYPLLLLIFNELEKAEKVLQILQDWSQVVDRLILGQHEPVREKELESSYHTPEFTEFMKGGWDKANELLGWKEFDDTRWTLECKTTALPQCHKFHCTRLAQPRTEFSVSNCYRDEKTRISKTDAGSLEGTPLARHV
ncbi:hypothetical protein IWW34DRAFT_811782 [Fusarium oxysporum f. sp. albedinis]|nr:hypothetical protein IWW34DRAFT_811782 [Fusarium oxysporum f. sp. albedinis]